MSGAEALYAHMQGGQTTVCRAWSVDRQDGVRMGFTDHDRPLSFDGVDFLPDSGLTARALVQTTGLAVDNTEAVGALSADAITEADLMAGRYDGAVVTAWLVNWQDVSARLKQFTGTIGEVSRAAGGFQAELRGLTEALNQPQGAVYQKPCGAVLGDARCKVDLDAPGMSVELAVDEVSGARVFGFDTAVLAGFAPRWFERGRFKVLSGAAQGLTGLVKNDREDQGRRVIELWQELRAAIAPGDLVRIEAGCDKQVDTCRLKFLNLNNFRGFPHVPGEDWIMTYPKSSGSANDGGSLFGRDDS